MHGGAHQLDAQRNQRIEIVIEGIAERRHEDHRAGRAGLVVVVHDLRETTRRNIWRFMLVVSGMLDM